MVVSVFPFSRCHTVHFMRLTEIGMPIHPGGIDAAVVPFSDPELGVICPNLQHGSLRDISVHTVIIDIAEQELRTCSFPSQLGCFQPVFPRDPFDFCIRSISAAHTVGINIIYRTERKLVVCQCRRSFYAWTVINPFGFANGNIEIRIQVKKFFIIQILFFGNLDFSDSRQYGKNIITGAGSKSIEMTPVFDQRFWTTQMDTCKRGNQKNTSLKHFFCNRISQKPVHFPDGRLPENHEKIKSELENIDNGNYSKSIQQVELII